MRKKTLLLLKFLSALLLIVGFKFNAQVNAESNQEYEIFPTPHELTYENGTLDLNTSVNLVLESDLDQETVDKIENVLNDHDVQYSKNDTILEEKINIAIGVKDSSEEVDQYFSENIGYKTQFDQIDAHQLDVNEKGIFISGRDTDASFYGIVSLNHILEQSEDLNVNLLSIEDYADTSIRGLIEGYYGIPWGNKNRADLIKFGGKFKANAFVFAPKDDPYHREKWRELYPAEEIEEIRSLAHLGNAEKNRYIWTIAPFKPESDPITDANKEEGIEALIAKFEQLYEADVRQFGVLGDDVGALPKETVVDVMNALVDWADEKGDIYDFVFVPQGYVLADWGFNANELDTYDQGFPDNVHIMFTGENTLSALTQDAVDGFKTKEAAYGERRDPLFWLNWPVNDIDREDYRRLFMGKAEMLEPGVTNIVGVLTNPMEESQPSKNAIFAVSDYAWNVRDFDADKSWDAGFKYFEPDTPTELHEIAKHMSSMNNGGIFGLEESTELGQLIEEFKESIASDSSDKLKNREKVEQYFTLISQSVETFQANSKQENLVAEMTPYINGLHDKSLAAEKYLQVLAIADKNGKKDEAQDLLDEANALKEQSASYVVNTKTAEFPAIELRAESGMLVINPFVDFIKDYATEEVENIKRAESIKEMKQTAEKLIEEDKIISDTEAHTIKLHLTALEHYEKQNNKEKIIKHLSSFKTLLNYQKEKELLSEKTYTTLYLDTVHLIEEQNESK